MALSAEDFYRSSNGDRWQLIRDSASGRSFVRHEPNLSSGGRVTDTDVEEFLNRTGSSPENLALRALLEKHGSMVAQCWRTNCAAEPARRHTV